MCGCSRHNSHRSACSAAAHPRPTGPLARQAGRSGRPSQCASFPAANWERPRAEGGVPVQSSPVLSCSPFTCPVLPFFSPPHPVNETVLWPSSSPVPSSSPRLAPGGRAAHLRFSHCSLPPLPPLDPLSSYCPSPPLLHSPPRPPPFPPSPPLPSAAVSDPKFLTCLGPRAWAPPASGVPCCSPQRHFLAAQPPSHVRIRRER